MKFTVIGVVLAAAICTVLYLAFSVVLRVPDPEIRTVVPTVTSTPQQTITISIPPVKTLTIGKGNE